MKLETKKVIARELLIFLSTVFIGLLLMGISQLMDTGFSRYELVKERKISEVNGFDPNKYLNNNKAVKSTVTPNLFDDIVPTVPSNYKIYNYDKIITVDYYLDDKDFASYKDGIINNAKQFPKQNEWGNERNVPLRLDQYKKLPKGFVPDKKWYISYKITNVQNNIGYYIQQNILLIGVIFIFLYPLQYFIRLVLWAIRTLKLKE